VKGLPLAYNTDLSEDKQAGFRARRDVARTLPALTALVSRLDLDDERLAAAVADPLLAATDAAEQLVREGVPFRDAHEQVARAVREGTFEPPAERRARSTPGPGGVREAIEAARARFAS
jgi:argininosuccinate lyase